MKTRIMIPLACLVVPVAAVAVEGESSAIVVTGAALPPVAGDTALSTARIEQQRLSSAGTERLESILADIAGFQMFRRSDSRSAHPTSQGVSLRGLGGNAASRAVVVLDGVPLDDPFGGWVNWAAVDPNGLSAVRAIRGGGLGANGPGSLAGAIMLESTLHADAFSYNGDLAYGSRDAIGARAAIMAPLGSGAGSLSARFDQGDGFIPITVEGRGIADRPAPYRQLAMRLRSAFATGTDGEMQMALAFFDDRRERGFDFGDSQMRGGDFSLRYVGRGKLPLEVLAYAKLRDFRTSFAALTPGRAEARQTLDQHTPSNGFGIRTEMRPQLGSMTLRIGADMALRSGTTRELFSFVAAAPTRRRVAGGQSLTSGLFAALDVPLADRLQLTGEARLDHWRFSHGQLREYALSGGALFQDVQPAARDGTEYTGRAAAAWRVADALTLRANGYRSFRLPTLNELYRPFRAGADGTAANAALAPERLWGAEAGLDWRAGQAVTIGMTGYWNRLEGAIANVTVAKIGNQCAGVGFVTGACRVRRNLHAVTVRGIEADAVWSSGPWRASLSYAYARARVSDGAAGVAMDGLRPAQTPAHQISSRIDWRAESGFGMGMSARYQSSRFEDDLQRIRLRDAFTVDAVIGVPIMKRLRAELRGENLFDAVIETAKGEDGVTERANPRTIWMSLSLR